MAEEKKIYFKSSGHLPEMWKGSVVNLAMPKRHRRGRRKRRVDPPAGREACGHKGKGSRSKRVKAAWRASGSVAPLKVWANQTNEGYAWLTNK